jgi:hypothetical protein
VRLFPTKSRARIDHSLDTRSECSSPTGNPGSRRDLQFFSSHLDTICQEPRERFHKWCKQSDRARRRRSVKGRLHIASATHITVFVKTR